MHSQSIRRWARVAVVIAAIGAAQAAMAIEPVFKNTFTGVAIRGTDPVAYFTDGKPVEGTKEFTHTWNGATWRFASAAHRDLFAQHPEQYAPQYGGYCAKAVSEGNTASIDPAAWKIVDGKLYLNYDLKIQKVWEANMAERIRKADANWPRLLKGEKIETAP